MFNVIFKNNQHYKYFNYNYLHYLDVKDGIIPPNTIVSNITRIKFTDFFTTLKITDDYKGFYMCRDPRDIIVSAYWSWLNSHPGGHINREAIKNLSKDDAMIFIIDEYETHFNIMYDWATKCDDNNFKIIKFEDFFKSDEEQIKNMIELFKFLNLTQDEKIITKIAKKNTFSHLSGRKRGLINNNHHYRAGTSTWKTEMSEKVLTYLYDKKGENFITNIGYKIF